jgi:hypothetical protein
VTTPPATTTRRLDYMPLDDLPEALRNAKVHDLPQIRRTIARFGYTTPVILDERTGRLVAGHGRRIVLMGMRDDGDTPPNGIELTDDGRWLVPVVRGWTSHSDAEAEALGIADNRLSELGGWEDRLLTEMLEELLDQAPELLAATGYSTDDVDRMLADFASGHPGSVAPAGGNPEVEAPGEFKSYDEDIETEWRCPRCSYEWSGKTA